MSATASHSLSTSDSQLYIPISTAHSIVHSMPHCSAYARLIALPRIRKTSISFFSPSR